MKPHIDKCYTYFYLLIPPHKNVAGCSFQPARTRSGLAVILPSRWSVKLVAMALVLKPHPDSDLTWLTVDITVVPDDTRAVLEIDGFVERFVVGDVLV